MQSHISRRRHVKRCGTEQGKGRTACGAHGPGGVLPWPCTKVRASLQRLSVNEVNLRSCMSLFNAQSPLCYRDCTAGVGKGSGSSTIHSGPDHVFHHFGGILWFAGFTSEWHWSGFAVALQWFFFWSGIAVALQWHCSGIGVALEWHWSGIGVGLEWHWSGIAVGLEWHWNGIGVALKRHWNGMGVALEWHWVGIALALKRHWNGMGVALEWDCSGIGVALE